MRKQQRRRASNGKPQIKLHVLGAAGGVTGSLNLVEYRQGDKVTYFLLDVGLHMESRRADFSNRLPRGVKASQIDFVLLSHAHLDHSGYLPKLIKEGFTGKVYCTEPTVDLCKISLPDSGYLQEQAAERASRRVFKQRSGASDDASGKSSRKKAQPWRTQPLYTEREARRSLKRLKALDYNRKHELAPGIVVRFTEAGHILGAAVTTVELGTGAHKRTICFTGNIGRRGAPLLKRLAPISGADYLITESTYGNRLHEKRNRLQHLAGILNNAYERAKEKHKRYGCGVILIPAFALDRTQVVLNDLRMLMDRGMIPEIPVFVDGRMSNAATEVYRKHWDVLNTAAQKVFEQGEDPFKTPRYAECVDWKQSEPLLKPAKEPIIVVSSSGMANGGRVVNHLRERLSGRQHTVVFVGYQGRSTLGYSLLRFAENPPSFIPPCPTCPRTVTVDGKRVTVRATVEFMPDYSAHADYEDMLWWMGKFRQKPKETFVVHGDPESLQGLHDRIEESLGWSVTIPRTKETFELT